MKPNNLHKVTPMSGTTEPAGQTRSKDFPYFRRIWQNVVVALLAAAFIPLLVIGGGMYTYSAALLRQKTLDTLRTEVLSHKNVIDQFLHERMMDLRLLADNLELNALTNPGAIERIFRSLHKGLPCFQDLGVIDALGRHRAYAGPYQLIDKNYQEALWFQALRDRDHTISDVFLGFRKVPHFIIAVKRQTADGFWILRATVDAKFFDTIVAGTGPALSKDAFLVNADGVFQTASRGGGQPMAPSRITDLSRHQGIRELDQNGHIQVRVWLDSVPWMCVVQTDRRRIFADLDRMRNIGIFVLILGSIMILFTVLLTTNYLIGRLEFKRKSIRALDHQLQQTSRLAAFIPLSSGFFLKLKDQLGHIDVAARQLCEPSRAETAAPQAPHMIPDGADRLRGLIFKGRKAIDNYLNAIRPLEPMIRDIDVNELLDNLIELFDREFHFNRIRVVRDYLDPPVMIRSDPTRLRQVFQNLLFNAMTAIGHDGEIALRMQQTESHLSVTVTDSGPGIAAENFDKIFDAHYTTRPEGMGLGLTICRNILKKIGGDISAANAPGKGAALRVELPLRFRRTEP